MSTTTDWVAHARERLIAAVRRYDALRTLGVVSSEILYAADMIDTEARSLAEEIAERDAAREAR
jgi:hypothetical protein